MNTEDNKARLKNSVASSALVVAEQRAAKAKQSAAFGDKPVEVPVDGRYTNQEYIDAVVSRITGPRSQRPSFRAILKTIKRNRAGLSLLGSWRSWAAL